MGIVRHFDCNRLRSGCVPVRWLTATIASLFLFIGQGILADDEKDEKAIVTQDECKLDTASIVDHQQRRGTRDRQQADLIALFLREIDGCTFSLGSNAGQRLKAGIAKNSNDDASGENSGNGSHQQQTSQNVRFTTNAGINQTPQSSTMVQNPNMTNPNVQTAIQSTSQLPSMTLQNQIPASSSQLPSQQLKPEKPGLLKRAFKVATKIANLDPFNTNQPPVNQPNSNELVLDSYAQTLFEAYEKETDPVLKQQLYEQLEQYLASNK